jgi:hypothetical protein
VLLGLLFVAAIYPMAGRVGIENKLSAISSQLSRKPVTESLVTSHWSLAKYNRPSTPTHPTYSQRRTVAL